MNISISGKSGNFLNMDFFELPLSLLEVQQLISLVENMGGTADVDLEGGYASLTVNGSGYFKLVNRLSKMEESVLV